MTAVANLLREWDSAANAPLRDADQGDPRQGGDGQPSLMELVRPMCVKNGWKAGRPRS